MFVFYNLDLLATGLAIIFFYLTGPIIYFQNTKNLTNKSYFIYSLLAGTWGLLNYFAFKTLTSSLFLLLSKLIMFSFVWINFFAYLVILSYPDGNLNLSKKFLKILIVITIFVSILTLTPFVLKEIKIFDNEKYVVTNPVGLAIIAFLIIFLNFLSFQTITKKIKTETDQNIKKNYLILLVAFFITTILIIIFNLILPNIFKINKFTQYSSWWLIPFIITISIGLTRFKLFNFQIIPSFIFMILLLFVNLFDLVQAKTLSEITLRIIMFIGFIIIGTFLVRSVYIEVNQRKKFEELNRIKTEFLSFTSHQIKTPLGVIKGYINIIMEEIEGVPEQVKEYANKIKNSADELLVLIEEFLDYRQIEEKKMEINFEEINFIQFVKEIVEKFSLLAKEKGLNLSFETKIDKALVKIDKIKFAQVIQNLIDNAIKYTKEGFVNVNLKQENNYIIVCVSDSGIGISKELQKKLFGEFVRDSAIKKEIKGTGLGLYIAKYIVEAHQGKIWAESEGENKGSKFFVKLPLG